MATLLEQDEMPSSTTIPHGFCHCDCGNKAPIAKWTNRTSGLIEGEPCRFLPGHNRRLRLSVSNPKTVIIDGVEYPCIPLSRGFWAIVDWKNFHKLMRVKWYAAAGSKGRMYAARNAVVDGVHQTIFMHSEIVGSLPEGKKFVDHKNDDSLDDREENLRPCTRGENEFNVGVRAHSTSGYTGVTWRKYSQKWRAVIYAEGVLYTLGEYDCKEDAARAYDAAAIKLHGEFAWLDFPEEKEMRNESDIRRRKGKGHPFGASVC